MNMRTDANVLRVAALAAAGVCALAGLSACEERPYSVPVRQAAMPAPQTTVLAGAPAYGAATPDYVAPPVSAAPSAYGDPPVATTTTTTVTTYEASPEPSSGQTYTAPPAYAPPQTYRPAPVYDTGGPMIVAMAPIPNPTGHGGRSYGPRPTPEPGYVPPHHRHHAYTTASAPPAPRPTSVAPAKPASVAPKPAYAAAKPAPVKPVAPPKTNAQAAPAAPPPKPATVTTGDKKFADAAKAATVVAAAKLADLGKPGAPAPAKPTAAPAPVGAGDRTTKLAALQAALTDAVSKNAVLTLPDHFTGNQPADVSLTLPADFAETVRKNADKQGLSDAAASVNMTSVLAGDGFTVTPDDSQSQPLTVGQPTEFHWTVTAQPNAKGPLHADVGAVLLGGGQDTLSLGTVQKNAGMQLKMTPKMLGAGILALIVIVVLGWLARGRSSPSRSGAARRAGRRARGGFDRPLDMDTSDTPGGDARA